MRHQALAFRNSPLLALVAVVTGLVVWSLSGTSKAAAAPGTQVTYSYSGLQFVPSGEDPLIHRVFRIRSDGVVEVRRLEMGRSLLWLDVDWTPARSGIPGGRP